MSRSRRNRRGGRPAVGGFTLLEVLAAVAILGMLFTILAGVTATGLRSEGTNLRRLRASLVADGVLGDIEAQMLAGVYPEEASQEYELEESEIPFTIRVEVRALEESASGGGEADMMAFLSEEVPDLMPLLRVVEVWVSWKEVDEEYGVHRQTYLFDQTQWAESLPEVEATGELPEEEGELE